MPPISAQARVENLTDRDAADRGPLPRDRTRALAVDPVYHEGGFGGLWLPRPLIARLGLWPMPGWPGIGRERFEGVHLTILGHDGTTEVAALPDDAPPRFGPIILTLLDLVIDPITRRATGNPAHGGEQMIERY